MSSYFYLTPVSTPSVSLPLFAFLAGKTAGIGMLFYKGLLRAGIKKPSQCVEKAKNFMKAKIHQVDEAGQTIAVWSKE